MYEAQNIAFLDIVVSENTGWFFNIGYNAILRIELDSGKILLESMLPEYYWGMMEAFVGIEYYDGKLFLAPRSDCRICIYSIQDKTFSFIELDIEKYGEEYNFNLFNTVKLINGKIYFFPGRFHSIVKLNPNDLSIEYVSYGYEKIADTWEDNKNKILIFNRIHIQQDKCIMPCWRSNIIVEFDLESETSSIYSFDESAALADSVYVNGNYICTFKNSDKVLMIDKGTGKRELLCSVCSKKGTIISKKKDTLILTPIYGTKIETYELNTKRINTIYQYPNEAEKRQEWLTYKNSSLCNKLIDERYLLFYSCKDGKIVLLTIGEDNYREIKIQLSEVVEKSIENQIGAKFVEEIHTENESFGLNNFVSDLLTIGR